MKLRYIYRQREKNEREKALVASERRRLKKKKKNMLNVKKRWRSFSKRYGSFKVSKGFLMVRIIYLGMILLICINELREQQMPREMLIT